MNKKFKSRDNHIKHVYYTHGPPSSLSPALVVATHPCCHCPPLLSCLPSSSPPTLVVATLIVTATHAHTCHCCPPSSSPPMRRIRAHCCCLPALIVAASASHPPSLRPTLVVVPAVRLLSLRLPLLLLPAHLFSLPPPHAALCCCLSLVV